MKKTRDLFWTFLKIGAFTFGGGYAMVALLEREFVEDKQWLSREEFLDMVAIAESTPGPVAVNSATYVGYKIEGAEGDLHALRKRPYRTAWPSCHQKRDHAADRQFYPVLCADLCEKDCGTVWIFHGKIRREGTCLMGKI